MSVLSLLQVVHLKYILRIRTEQNPIIPITDQPQLKHDCFPKTVKYLHPSELLN